MKPQRVSLTLLPFGATDASCSLPILCTMSVVAVLAVVTFSTPSTASFRASDYTDKFDRILIRFDRYCVPILVCRSTICSHQPRSQTIRRRLLPKYYGDSLTVSFRVLLVPRCSSPSPKSLSECQRSDHTETLRVS
jgi:hypothetical protein